MNKEQLIADFIPALRSAEKKISTLMYISEQDKVVVFFTNGATEMIPVPGEGLQILKALVDGIIGGKHGVRS